MSMIDPKGSRPSALVNLARLHRTGNLKLVKTDVPDGLDKAVSPSSETCMADIDAA